jgi:WhiB family transcriptional regulator, redox-sensing transcriptional regulator
MTAPWTALNLMLEYRVGSWIEDAACAGEDPDMFFPKRDAPARAAKAVCAGCPVREACRDYAVRAPIMLAGVWGGTTERERGYAPINTSRRVSFPERFLELRGLGYSDRQIVTRMGLQPKSVLRQMRRNGIPASAELTQDVWKITRKEDDDRG